MWRFGYGASKRSIRTSVVASLLVFGLATPITTSGKSGRGVGSQLLFVPPGIQPSGLTNPSAYKRKRLMILNSSWLLTARATAENVQPGSALFIFLFDDVLVKIVIDRTQFRSKRRFLIQGQVENIPNSIVLLAFVEDALAGSIHVPGIGKFEIRFAGKGQHWIIERDPNMKAVCGVGLEKTSQKND